jgi:RNA-directed DNA polymerase
VKRVLIPKPGGGERPLGIPTIRDRVVQAAAKIVLEPIFESTFDPAAYGYRPERNAVDAVEVASDALRAGRTQVIDADLSKYFDTIPHHELLTCLAKRIIDRKVLHLIKMWLKVPIEETDERGNKRMTGGKRSTRGTPQGGVISPLLANIYIHRFIRAFRLFGLAEKFGAILSNYADDFVVLCRHGAHAALNRIDDWLTRIGLTLNREKTSVKNVWKQSFDYLGYTLGVRYSGATKRRYLGVLPSQKSREQFRARVRSSLRSANFRPVAEVVDRLNRILRGWGNYFNYGEIVRLRRGMDWYTMERVRDHLRRRHKVAGRGTRRFSRKYIRDTLGLVTLEAMPRRRLTHACT